MLRPCLKKLILISCTVVIGSALTFAKDGERGLLTEIQPSAKADNDLRNFKAEVMITKSEKLAIVQLEKLIEKNKGRSSEVDLWFRLAELHMRRAKSGRFFELNRNAKGLLSLSEKYVRDQSSQKSLNEAIRIYTYIQNKFPHFPQLDTVIFNNAFANQQLNQTKEALRLFQSVLNSFPQSEWVPDVHLALGEMYYNAHQFEMALNHYLSIKKYPDAKVYPYGIYKGGWAYYNLHESDKAMKELEFLVNLTPQFMADNQKRGFELRTEALRDLTLFFGDVYKAKDAFSYFNSLAEAEEVGLCLINLAKIFQSHSQHKDIVIFLNDFTNNMPFSRHLPQAYDLMVWNYETLKDRKAAFEVMSQYADTCKASSDWRQKLTEKDTEDCQKLFPATTISLAKSWWDLWKKAQEQKDPKYDSLSQYAAGSFEFYLESDAKADNKVKARLGYADLLYQMKEFRKASSQYSTVSKEIPRIKENSELSHNADYSAIVSLEKAVGDKWEEQDEKLLLELSTNYLNFNPEGKYFIDIQFKLALLDYDKGRLEKAKPALLSLSQNIRAKEKMAKAQDLYLDILNQEKKFTELKNMANDLEKKCKDAERKKILSKIYFEAYFAEIKAIESSGNKDLAVKEFLTLAQKHPETATGIDAFYEAIRIEFTSGHVKRGAELARTFSKKFPQDKRADKMLEEAARTYEDMAQLSLAAETLVELAKVDKKDSNKWLEIAADFYYLEKKQTESLKLYEGLLAILNNKDQARIISKIDRIYEEQEREDLRTGLWPKMIALNFEPQASVARLGQLKQVKAKGDNNKAFDLAKNIMKTSGIPPYIKAEARLIQAEIIDEEFRAQSVKARAEKIAQVIALKAEKLEKTQAAYQAVMSYGDYDTQLKSLIKLSETYDHFTQSLRSMPQPQGISDADFKGLTTEIEQMLRPIEDSKMDTISKAIDLASKADLNDKRFSWAKEKLAQFIKVDSKAATNKQNVPPIWLPDFKLKN